MILQQLEFSAEHLEYDATVKVRGVSFGVKS